MEMISVILPTYNEKEAIVSHANHVSAVLTKAGYKHEVIVVDDDSPDGTAVVARKASQKNKNIKVTVRKNNHGLGLSIGEGIRLAKGTIIIGMDSDGNHDPRDLPRMLKALTEPTKLVVASRFARNGGMAGWRMIPTFLFNAMFRLWGLPIWDNTSGYYAVSKKDLISLGVERIYYGYGDYHLRLLWYAKENNWIIKEIPTTYQARIGGETKSKLSKMAVDYTREVMRLKRGS